jgi:hypothetical protein
MMTPRVRLPGVHHDPSSPPSTSEEVAISPHKNAFDIREMKSQFGAGI